MSRNESSGNTGWDQKISEAKAMLVRVEAKAQRLREAIVTFQEEKHNTESATQN